MVYFVIFMSLYILFMCFLINKFSLLSTYIPIKFFFFQLNHNILCTRAHPNKYFFKISYYLSFHLPKLVLQYLFSPLWLDLTFRVISNMVKTHFLCLPLLVSTFSFDLILLWFPCFCLGSSHLFKSLKPLFQA